IEDIVVFSGCDVFLATGSREGEAVEFAFDRRTGKALKADAQGEYRDDLFHFVEGLRETYVASLDGGFHDFVVTAAGEAGISLPKRNSNG
ncbi:MAG: hypothetical protein WBC85_09755, partial [Planktotalea sp.]|uniref:hypothetical protein n=1 Tax=Planktotalea sp. TaxID=2029877 RepID=UPI003C78758C